MPHHDNDNDPAAPIWALRELPDGTSLWDLLMQEGGVPEPEAPRGSAPEPSTRRVVNIT